MQPGRPGKAVLLGRLPLAARLTDWTSIPILSPDKPLEFSEGSPWGRGTSPSPGPTNRGEVHLDILPITGSAKLNLFSSRRRNPNRTSVDCPHLMRSRQRRRLPVCGPSTRDLLSIDRVPHLDLSRKSRSMWNLKQAAAIVAGWVLATGSFAGADDWTRFRGPNGSGVAAAGESVPAEWGDDQNLAWKLALRGPGWSWRQWRGRVRLCLTHPRGR